MTLLLSFQGFYLQKKRREKNKLVLWLASVSTYIDLLSFR